MVDEQQPKKIQYHGQRYTYTRASMSHFLVRDLTVNMILIIVMALMANTATARVDNLYRRLAPGEYQLELALFRDSSNPEIPFKNFSAAYVKKALATPTNWTSAGAVTPVKDQGEHGYCGTFGRVAACEGQFFLKAKSGLFSFSEEELIDCIGWDQDQASYFMPNGT